MAEGCASALKEACLYVIATPIGDLPWDAQVAASYYQEVLRSVRHYLVEGERVARRFLAQVFSPQFVEGCTFVSVARSAPQEWQNAFWAWIRSGNSVGLMSDAGYPGLMDPGSEVVAFAHRRGIRVVPLVGPSSYLLAAVCSGFGGSGWLWLGYLPRERGRLVRAIHRIRRYVREGLACFWMETPYRTPAHFREVVRILPDSLMLMVAQRLLSRDQWIRVQRVRAWRAQYDEVGLVRAPAILGVWQE